MHPTALANCHQFFASYGTGFIDGKTTIVEIGSQDVNGSLRSVAPSQCKYIGVDFVAGKGVDVILDDPYTLPFETGSVDVVLSSSVFEHSEMFWVLYLEIIRILKSPGLFYLNVPSNGEYHRWPVDCWRFYPDSGRGLVAWAKRNDYDVTLLESYTSKQSGDIWNDFVAVFLKGTEHAHQFPGRITQQFQNFDNGVSYPDYQITNHARYPEDLNKLKVIAGLVNNQLRVKL